MKIKKTLTFIVIAILLLLTCWSRSWFLFSIILLSCLFLWHPTVKKQFLNLWKQLPKQQKKYLEWLPFITSSIVLIWFVNSFLFSIYTIHSSSMLPTIKSGKALLMNKLKPGPAQSIDRVNTYYRLEGIRKLQRNDIVIFHFPEADTVFVDHPYENYHFKKRQYQITKTFSPLLESKINYQRVSKRPLFIKRIIALPGDTLKISDGDVIINNHPLASNASTIEKYILDQNTPTPVKEKAIRLSQAHYKEKGKQVVEIVRQHMKANNLNPYLTRDGDPMNMPDAYVFPFSPYFYWNASFWGPVVIPAKGATVALSIQNIALYRRIIETYEENHLEICETDIFINGQKADTYTFKMNYYWVAGDNRPHSFDSRYWGFVPENHIVGTVTPITF